MEWHEAVDLVVDHVLQITTPNSQGTGWLVSRSNTTTLCAIATAAHVVDYAHAWELPIRLWSPSTGESRLLRFSDRAILIERSLDTAAIIFDCADFTLPEQPLPLIEPGNHFVTGVEIGWVGFPAIHSELCFFSGRVSSYHQDRSRYLIDGVAINGVSGGPAFRKRQDDAVALGVLTAYIANRATGETLPGLSVVQDVTQFHNVTRDFANLDAAKERETAPTEAPIPPERPNNDPPAPFFRRPDRR